MHIRIQRAAEVAALILVVAGLVRVATAGAQTPGCRAAIMYRESRGDYYAVNATSGAFGAYQFLPTGGVYGITPLGRQGVPVQSLTPDQQDETYAWVVQNVGYGPWGGC